MQSVESVWWQVISTVQSTGGESESQPHQADKNYDFILYEKERKKKERKKGMKEERNEGRKKEW